MTARRISDETKREAVALLASGYGWAKTAKKFGVSQGRLSEWKKQVARMTATNGNGADTTAKKSRASKYTDEFKRDALAQMNAPGAKPQELAKKLGVDQSTLYGWKKKLGPQLVDPSAKPLVVVPVKPQHVVSDGVTRDAILYLRHARSKVMQQVVHGKIKELDEAHLLMMLALRALEGGS